MRLSLGVAISFFLVGCLLDSCVDPEELTLRGTVNVLVVDGTITNLAEPQLIRINRSKANPFSGRFGTLPITKATVQVVIDSAQVIDAHETEDGNYQLPSDFKGQVGHAYQLRFTLPDGTQYTSDQQVMPATVAISSLYHRFNATSLPAQQPDGTVNHYRGASDLFVDWQDPTSQHNYYRWDWILWERQEWCRQCIQGFYYIWQPNNESLLREDCQAIDAYIASQVGAPYFVNDYQCRTQCWEILYGYDLNLFDDALSDGGQLTGRRVAQIPYYQATGCLLEIRQSTLTERAHRYFRLVQQQTQNTGGLADTPPAAPIGNVQNTANRREAVVGYFTADAVSAVRYWLDRKDATGRAPGLFEALHGGLVPSTEDVLKDPNTGNFKFSLGVDHRSKNAVRPPTAVCVPSDSRTPYKPEGWRD